jgi:signal transduction histidine kinase
MKLPAALKRHSLWVGFVAVLAPLLILLALQYRWLAELDRTSSLVHKATLDNFVGAVVSDVEYEYRKLAERTLNLPSSVFTQPDRLDRAAKHFRKKGVEGVKRLFVIRSAHGKEETLYFDPSCSSFYPARWSPEARAVWIATASLRALAHKGGVLEQASLAANELDPEHRMILNPITDDASTVVGVAGILLDERHFRDEVLARAVRKAIPEFFPEGQEPVVFVRDQHGDVVFASADAPAPPGGDGASRHFSFVFHDWRIDLDSRHLTAGQVAKRNFALNIGLSAVLAAVLLGGVILALRTASREMHLSQMKADFVSNVSHELRTPLASIRVFGELLRLGRVEDRGKIREYGDYIETESRRLTQLINNILDFSKIESGCKNYRFERADVTDLVTETLRTFEVRLRQHGFEVAFEGPRQPLPPVLLDPGAIAQSLSNLLDNAMKYSNGEKEIAVSLRRDGGFVVISVKDRGFGIPRDEQEKIFDRFHRVSTGLLHDVKGSGLGLAIVRHIVEAHHGRVTVESRPGEGSTFSIHLPIEPLPAARTEAAPELPRERPSEA